MNAQTIGAVVTERVTMFLAGSCLARAQIPAARIDSAIILVAMAGRDIVRDSLGGEKTPVLPTPNAGAWYAHLIMIVCGCLVLALMNASSLFSVDLRT